MRSLWSAFHTVRIQKEGSEMSPDREEIVSIVIPTYNESRNIETLLRRLDRSLKTIPYEAIIVDDNSPDGTAHRAERLSPQLPVKVMMRSGKLGLASAVLAGLGAARGDVLGFMDADLSHPPEILPELLAAIRDQGADIAVASRLVKGGGVSDGWPQHRKLNSYVATLLARPLTRVKDSMSGCFMFKREVIECIDLVPRGYKIGLEILVKGKYQDVVEVPFLFDNRANGASKLTLGVQMEYLVQVLHLYADRLTGILRKENNRV